MIDDLLLIALNEDLLPGGDVTTDCLIDNNHKSDFELVVNENAILAGGSLFEEIFYTLDKNIKIVNNYADGNKLSRSTVVAKLSGSTRAILKGERSALNLISHLSGIASITRELVELIKHTNVILLDTRKTTPGLRSFEKAAILAGGGKNHRFNLSEMVLIKDNHIKNVGGVKKTILKVRECYKDKYKIEVEVNDIHELEEALECNPDVIMLDNWEIPDIKKALKLIPKNIPIEVSGQINKKNILEYAELGVNYISTSYMIKNTKWVDFSLNAV